MRSRLTALWPMALLALAGGCAMLSGPEQAPPDSQGDTSAAALREAQRTLDDLALLEQFGRGDPSQQADMVERVRRDAEASPTFAHRLRYALVIAMPGHGASDPAAASAALSDLLAAPEGLLPAEAALAYVMLQGVNARLALLDEKEALVATGREDQERSQALNRRLQGQVTENARLKQELEEALAKLEAVADLERSLVERQAVPKGQQP